VKKQSRNSFSSFFTWSR